MSETATAFVETYDDGSFVRTAITVPEKGVSFDLVSTDGIRVAEINAFLYRNEDGGIDHIIIDVIDKDDLFGDNRGFSFLEGIRTTLTAGRLVCADFKKRTASQTMVAVEDTIRRIGDDN